MDKVRLLKVKIVDKLCQFRDGLSENPNDLASLWMRRILGGLQERGEKGSVGYAQVSRKIVKKTRWLDDYWWEEDCEFIWFWDFYKNLGEKTIIGKVRRLSYLN